MAILGFADKETEKIYSGHFSRRLPTDIQRTALRKLIYMAGAQSVSQQYRICFTVQEQGFADVEITDYH